MKKLKVMTVVGTRPEIIRLSELIKKLDQLDFIDHVLVHTGQNYDYELNKIFFEDLSLREPNYYLNAAMDSPTATIGKTLIEMDKVLGIEKPDKFLILGDTNSALSAIAAKKRRIPIYHMEAGNRCFDDRVPEETNRKLIDHISDLNFPYTSIARDYLLSEGIHPRQIIKTGSPMMEVIDNNMSKVLKSKVLNNLKLGKNDYVLVSIHRDENVSNINQLKLIVASINMLSKKYKVVLSLHPRTEKEIKKSELNFDKVLVSKPFSYTDFLWLQMNALVVLSDSGTISEEASILGIKAINLRYSQERPEAMEQGTIPLSGLGFEEIYRTIQFVLDRDITNIPEDYKLSNFTNVVLNAVFSVNHLFQGISK
jgi:UDP-N-acetyl-L-fucosamine synthase